MGNVQNIMGVLYSCTTFLGMFNMMSVMPILGYERSVMYRSVYAISVELQTDAFLTTCQPCKGVKLSYAPLCHGLS